MSEIKSFMISGYKSFGHQQQFCNLKKINILIGQNECGKSNALSFIKNILPELGGTKDLSFHINDKHKGSSNVFSGGFQVSKDELLSKLETIEIKNDKEVILKTLNKIFNNFEKNIWLTYDQENTLITNGFQSVFKDLKPEELMDIYKNLREWPDSDIYDTTQQICDLVFNKMLLPKPSIDVISIGTDRSFNKELISKFKKYRDGNRIERKKISTINEFLRSIFNDNSLHFRVDSDDNLKVEKGDDENYKDFELNQYGTGLKHLLIFAIEMTLNENKIITLEEPENHINPILQKKLINYLLNHTNNQYFIATHSASFINSNNVNIYHLTNNTGETQVIDYSSNYEKFDIFRDLGYLPSDFLQSNCIIWVEGPSDRIYINYWISIKEPLLQEGIHYTIMFYGGKLLSHLTVEEKNTISDKLIPLLSINRRFAIIIDSDKSKENDKIRATKNRIVRECKNGFTWITQGREIENYINYDKISNAINLIHSGTNIIKKDNIDQKFGHHLKIEFTTKEKEKSVKTADKIKVAQTIIKDSENSFNNLFDLETKVDALIHYIKESNPKIIVGTS